MRFPDAFLDQLRKALPVLTVVSKRHKMRKAGAARYEAMDDASLTVNTANNLWYDFGKAQHGGDIIEFEMHATGCTFQEAVERLAADAALPLPAGYGIARPRPAASTIGNGQHAPEPPPHDGIPGPGASYQTAQRSIVATYDYLDREELLRYQVARFEWQEGGKHRKATQPRRPTPGEVGTWIWGLKGGLHLRGRSGDWYQATDDKLAKWEGAERREFEEVAPLLYRLPDLLAEGKQEPDEQRAVYCPEGEKDADTIAAWGMLATTCMGGTNGWQPTFGEQFYSMDVVILADNDQAGRAFAQAKAAAIRPHAKRVRLLDWRDHWPGCPDKADVTDWRDKAGGTADKLFEIVDRLKDWVPQPPESHFNALRFVDLSLPRRPLEWLVKGIMQRGELSVWFGDWGTGKSFILTDAAFAIAKGVQWFGLRTRLGLVLYQAGEGAIGFGNRMEAHRRHNHIPEGDDVPFVALRSRVNLHVDNADIDKLVAEAQAWASFYGMPVEFMVIDTFSAATAGADENSGRDVGPVLERARRICTVTGAHVAIVHHVPKSGSGPRGWSGFLGNVDSAVLVETTEQHHEEQRDDGVTLRRPIHQFTVVKQKDAEARLGRQFTLPQVVLGQDNDGDPITSCVVAPLGTAAMRSRKEVPKGYHVLLAANEDIFRALVRVLTKRGRPAPPGLKETPPPGTQCCTIAEWHDELIEQIVGHEEVTDRLRARIKARVYRASKGWAQDKGNLIAKGGEWVWRTSRKVYGVDKEPPPMPAPPPNPKPTLAPGETDDGLPFA